MRRSIIDLQRTVQVEEVEPSEWIRDFARCSSRRRRAASVSGVRVEADEIARVATEY